MKIPLMKKTFYNEFYTKLKLANFILKSERLSMGEKCIQFESDFAKWHGRKFAILFNSGASANLALFQSLKNLSILKEKDAVGFSSVTWSTNIMPVIQTGMEPVPIDCSVETLNISSKELNKTLSTKSIKCLFITNALGFTGDLYEIEDVCNKNGIILLEDNCESLGTRLDPYDMTGNFGLASTSSFFVGHHMSTIEGGMILTDDENLSDMAILVRANGWDRNLSSLKRYELMQRHNVSNFESKYAFYDLAFNMRPTEITGFLGLEQLKYLDEIIDLREENYIKVRRFIEENDDFLKLKIDHLSRLSAFSIPFLCYDKKTRDMYIQKFEEEGIEVRPMIAGNITNQPFWKKYYKDVYTLKGADFIHNNGFYCANRPDFTDEDISTIENAIKINENCSRVSSII